MTAAVLDASAVMAWLWPPQATPASSAFRLRTTEFTLEAPFVFDWEVRNLVLKFFGRGREGDDLYDEAIDTLEDFGVTLDLPRSPAKLEPLARTSGLSLFDAAYLDLAQQRGIPLISRDKQLLKEARRSGVTVHDLT